MYPPQGKDYLVTNDIFFQKITAELININDQTDTLYAPWRLYKGKVRKGKVRKGKVGSLPSPVHPNKG